jgi:hypothetical protein
VIQRRSANDCLSPAAGNAPGARRVKLSPYVSEMPEARNRRMAKAISSRCVSTAKWPRVQKLRRGVRIVPPKTFRSSRNE